MNLHELVRLNVCGRIRSSGLRVGLSFALSTRARFENRGELPSVSFSVASGQYPSRPITVSHVAGCVICGSLPPFDSQKGRAKSGMSALA